VKPSNGTFIFKLFSKGDQFNINLIGPSEISQNEQSGVVFVIQGQVIQQQEEGIAGGHILTYD
jgi:hypothetical protein